MTTFNACEVGLDPPTSKQPLEPDNRILKIKKLKAKLINEEHRLVLMKKIRQSQTRPVSAQQQAASGSGGPNSLGQNSNSNSLKKMRQQALQRSAMAAAAAAAANQTGGISMQRNQQHQLHNPSHSALSKHLYNLSSSTSSTSPSSNNQLFNNSSSSANTSLNQTPAHAHQRPKVNTLWNPPQQARHPTPVGIAPPHVGNLSRPPITTPPNVVQAMIGGAGGQQSLMMGTNNLTTLTTGSNRRQPQLQGTFNNKSQAAQLLLQQKRSAAKSALQKPLATSPNNIVQAMLGGGQQSLLMNANNLTPPSTGNTTRRQPQLQGTFNKSQAAQMLLQKRTAAKSAIQKQLEQTLMQLPPKQVQMGIDFVPNANNIEFVYYVGLEACVDYLTGTKNPLDMQPLEKPFECSTCGTDFTPTWSWKRSQAVCENCVGNQVKKSIKNSQSSRIKSVLAKAAKQEQDMDQRIMAEAANVVSTSQPATSTSHQSQQHSLLQPASHQTRTSSHSNSNNNSSNSNSQIWPRMNASPLSAVSSNSNSNNNNNSTSNTQIWNRINASPLTAPNSNRSANVQHSLNPNPLAAMQPAALQSLLQMNPQLSAIASLMSPSNNNSNANNNQFAQVAALLMNQLTMNMWNKR